MNAVAWKEKIHFAQELVSGLMRDGNKNLDLSARQIWHLVPVVGCELHCQISHLTFEDDWCAVSTLRSWVLAGFTLQDEFPDWTGPQLMAALAAYLLVDTEQLLDDLPDPGRTTYAGGLNWRRDQVIERCAQNIMDSMQACIYGRQLIGVEITLNPVKLAELMRSHDSEKAKRSVSARQDQKLKPGWLEHCRKAIDAGIQIERLDDLLNVPGYDQEIVRIQPSTLRKWAGLAGIAFKPGRPKSR